MRRINLKKYMPVGRDPSAYLKAGVAAWIAASVYELGFFLINYVNELANVRRMLKIRPVMKIPAFYGLIENGFRLFPLVWLVMALEVISAYGYHRMGSMSIYLMRRLPDRWELHRRCWTLPVLITLGSLASMGLIALVCYGIYRGFTPAEWLPV